MAFCKYGCSSTAAVCGDRTDSSSKFTIAEALNADEAFLTSASTFVLPIVELDGRTIGDGQPGPISKRMRAIYIDEALSVARQEAA